MAANKKTLILVWIEPSLRRKGWEPAISSVLPKHCTLTKRRPSSETTALWFVPQDKLSVYAIDQSPVILVPCLPDGTVLLKSSILPWISAPLYRDSNRYGREVVLRQALQNLQNRVGLLANSIKLDRVNQELKTLQTIGIGLTSEPHLETLLELIVTKAREVMKADAGSLYRVVSKEDGEEGKELYFVVAQNESVDVPFQAFRMPLSKTSVAGYVALTGKVISIEDVYRIPADRPYGFNKDFDKSVGYRGKSMLAAPLTTHKGDVIGVLQLINKKENFGIPFASTEAMEKDSLPFGAADRSLAVALGSQAAIAIENASLYEDIRNLLDSFMHASVKAIESRDPTTSGHSERVANYTVTLAEEVDRVSAGSLRKHKFSIKQLDELRFAGILHDFGKIGVRENVLTKSKKLYPQEFDSVRARYDYMRRVIELRQEKRKVALLTTLPRQKALDQFAALEMETSQSLLRLDRAYKVILDSNEPTILPGEQAAELEGLLHVSFPDIDGGNIDLLTGEEFHNLCIAKGSLNPQERDEIESHVTHTFQFLQMIPWTADLAGVPDIAYRHHEKLDGSGYPRGLTAKDIPVQVRMMTIADIFDALTAQDRPYKKAVPIDRALNILNMECDEGKLDPELVALFATSKRIRKMAVDS